MPDNSSSFSTNIVLYLVNGFVYNCFDSRVGNIIFAAFTITSFLLIFPLSVITLYLGHQLWRRKPSTLTSHSDFFTYHMVVMEMIYLSAAVTYCIGVYTGDTPVMVAACYVFYISSCGQMSFHTLTCVERYLAVVFPITYMHVSKGSGVRLSRTQGVKAHRARGEESESYHVVGTMLSLNEEHHAVVQEYANRQITSEDRDMTTFVTCFDHRTSIFSFTAFSITSILLLFPLCMLIICLGLQQWRKRRSASAAETSHSDIFTYHMVAMEMIGILGCGLYCCGVCLLEPWLVLFGVYFFTATSNGQIFFHILTCAERHLAVVHPILYRGLKQRGGVRIRNITIGLSVLHTLKRPGPGDGGGNRARADKTKMKAFQTITIILGALLLRFGGHLLGWETVVLQE
ncbi:hypothetical protein D5F01_LYC22916 [Xyrichtys novacula]|uniref:G-protein coupled receptors family 1 profile domain-containing protein n=1 Tax=Xyrichtys novacula TaxID=13765 RepID=A0AAV1HID6_XYRNO|nr:hypothetical protein D5F01_LYC22916 [Xyrichtys novacula]